MVKDGEKGKAKAQEREESGRLVFLVAVVLHQHVRNIIFISFIVSII